LPDIVVVGGGLAGLVSASLLAKNDFKVVLIEKNQYPFHRVCGEYLSEEVIPFLVKEGLWPTENRFPRINQLYLTNNKGEGKAKKLPLGGVGISRYLLDDFLAKQALELGVDIRHAAVTNIDFDGAKHTISTTDNNTLQAPVVIGSFGKNSKLDRSLNREWLGNHRDFIAVKYHVAYPFADDLIALHNFEGGYCGVSMIEDQKINVCYLVDRKVFKRYGNIYEFEDQVMAKNKALAKILKESKVLFDKPKVINGFTFKPKPIIEDHVLMCGDSAGLITPLCGNGMAMAIHSAKLLVDSILKFPVDQPQGRTNLEYDYSKSWNRMFSHRLWVGRSLQKMFGNRYMTKLLLGLMNYKRVSNYVISQTHGKPFS